MQRKYGEKMNRLFVTRREIALFRWLTAISLLVFILAAPAGLIASDLSGLKRKAEQGESQAQVDLATKYYMGKGVPQDFDEAVKWYLKAAERGNPDAQIRFGFMYGKGLGVNQGDQPMEGIGFPLVRGRR